MKQAFPELSERLIGLIRIGIITWLCPVVDNRMKIASIRPIVPFHCHSVVDEIEPSRLPSAVNEHVTWKRYGRYSSGIRPRQLKY